jgi:hypothetical protein
MCLFSNGTEESSRNGRKSEDAMENSEFNPPFPVPDKLNLMDFFWNLK